VLPSSASRRSIKPFGLIANLYGQVEVAERAVRRREAANRICGDVMGGVLRRSGGTFKPRVAGSNPVAGTKSELNFPLMGSVTPMAHSQRIAIGIAKPRRLRELLGGEGRRFGLGAELGEQRFFGPLLLMIREHRPYSPALSMSRQASCSWHCPAPH